MTPGLRIGDLARQTRCQVETIRYYESEGLLPAPRRSASNYRLYGEEHVERLAFIRRCRSLDMALDEIRALLDFRDRPSADCEGVNRLLDEHIGHVATRMAELEALAKQLRRLRRLCRATQATKDCGIMQSLSTGAADGGRSPGAGVHTAAGRDRVHERRATRGGRASPRT
jgi:Cd(II)/Pb(II)-responsive transcriptional regulator